MNASKFEADDLHAHDNFCGAYGTAKPAKDIYDRYKVVNTLTELSPIGMSIHGKSMRSSSVTAQSRLPACSGTLSHGNLGSGINLRNIPHSLPKRKSLRPLHS